MARFVWNMDSVRQCHRRWFSCNARWCSRVYVRNKVIACNQRQMRAWSAIGTGGCWWSWGIGQGTCCLLWSGEAQRVSCRDWAALYTFVYPYFCPSVFLPAWLCSICHNDVFKTAVGHLYRSVCLFNSGRAYAAREWLELKGYQRRRGDQKKSEEIDETGEQTRAEL